MHPHHHSSPASLAYMGTSQVFDTTQTSGHSKDTAVLATSAEAHLIRVRDDFAAKAQDKLGLCLGCLYSCTQRCC